MSERPGRSILFHLTLFAAALLTPALLFAGALSWRHAADERARTLAELHGSAKALTVAIEQEVHAHAMALAALSASPALLSGNWRAFHEEASLFARSVGQHVVLRSADAQVINTRYAYGDPLPRTDPARPDDTTPGVTGVRVGNLVTGGAEAPRFTAVAPIVQDGDVALLLELDVSATRARDVIERAALPAGWMASFVDRDLVLIARSPGHEAFVGKRATEAFMQTLQSGEPDWVGVSHDGVPILGSWARSDATGWIAAVGVPLTVIEAPARRSAAAIAGMGLILLGTSLLLAFWFGRRIATPVLALTGSAAALGRGGIVRPLHTPVAEVNGVSRAVADASHALAMGRAALESSEERLSLAQEAGGIGNWDWDLASGDVTMSTTCRRLLKLPLNAPTTARSLLDAIHPEDRSRVEAALEASLALDAPYDQEFRVLADEGGVCWLMSRAEVLRGPESAPYRVVGIVADITARREAEAKVAQALVELATSVQQKEVLLREVNHRVKYSLAIVSSLLAMQSRRITDPEARRPFIEASERVRTVAAVHERLYRGSDLNRMDAGLFVRDLVNDLRAAGLMVDTAVSLTTESVIIGADQSVVLGLILNELLTNADKYGRPVGRPAEVAVSLRSEAAGYVLTVADNGPGAASGINPLQADGLGMRLVRALSRQLHAELRLTRPARGGLAFHIHVPVNRTTDVPPLEATG